ncbi:MAG: ABC transporter substrate-binding protein [Propionibacteriaceae bacterium]|nr:ABC transporter substrate-binding protein [Propionibacteriaceae bacterium]
MRRTSVRSRAGAAITAALGVLLMTLLAACGPGPVPPQQAAEARAATSGPTGSMTVQLPERPGGFDPFAPPGTADQMLAAMHFEPLVTAVDGRLIPRMATWWLSIEDGQRHLVNVRRDLWSDGSHQMGAADLLFTVEAHLRPGSRSPLLPALLQIRGAREFHEGRAQHVAGITADTSRSTVIALTDPDPHYLSRLTGLFVLPRHVYAGQDLQNADLFREPAVGSGPYVFDAWQGGDQVTLKPNAEVKPFTRLDHVVARVSPPGQVLAALAEGEVGVAVDVPLGEVGNPPEGYRTVQAPGSTLVGLSGRGPLADVRLRQALAYAIDREGILAEHLGGHGRVVDSVLFTPDWANSPQRARYPHDPQRARELLAQAGWTESGELSIVALTADSARGVWDAVVADLAEVGVRARVTVRPVGERAAVWADPQVDAVIETYRMPMPDPVLIESWVSCGRAPSGLCDPALDRLLAEGRGQTVATERQQTYWAADELLAERLPVVPLWLPDDVMVLPEKRQVGSPGVQPATAMVGAWGTR